MIGGWDFRFSSSRELKWFIRTSLEMGQSKSKSGGAPDNLIQSYTSQFPLVVFSSSWCPFCQQVAQALNGASLNPKIVEVDGKLKSSLLAATGKSSVPSVWVGDKYIGGCNDGPESWMGTIPNLNNGNIAKWLADNAAKKNSAATKSSASTPVPPAGAQKAAGAPVTGETEIYDCHGLCCDACYVLL